MFKFPFGQKRKNVKKTQLQKTMDAIPSMSYQQLDEMHEILLVYAQKYPFCIPELVSEADYARKVAEFERMPIENGGVFGCRTCGEAVELNEMIVRRLDELER